MSPDEIYARTMENDAQFIESVGSVFNGVANLQRTIVKNLDWNPENIEFQKIQKASALFNKARDHLFRVVTDSYLLLEELPLEQKKKFRSTIKIMESKIPGLESRLDFIVKSIEKKKLPETDYIHETIKLALAGVGLGIEISKSNCDPIQIQKNN